MKKSVRTLMPIPEGYVVLTKEPARVKPQWVEQENTRNFRLAEHTDCTTALYRVCPVGRIELDCESVLVQKLFCLHCGEPLSPDLDSVTGYADTCNFYCTVCGRNIEINKEDKQLWKTMYALNRFFPSRMGSQY